MIIDELKLTIKLSFKVLGTEINGWIQTAVASNEQKSDLLEFADTLKLVDAVFGHLRDLEQSKPVLVLDQRTTLATRDTNRKQLHSNERQTMHLLCKF